MNSKILSVAIAAVFCAFNVTAQQAPTADQFVSAFEKLGGGPHPGERVNHIIGLCVSGSFVGAKDVQAYTRSALFSGVEVPVIGRFSLAGGNPKAPDAAKSSRGLALQFKLPGNNLHHFTMLNIPVFGASTLETFYAALLSNMADPATGKPDPEKQKKFRETHPDTKPLGEFMAKNNPPSSYANSDFFGIHTFKFVNASNQTTLVRWQFVPEDGVKRLTDAELATAPTRFLDEDFLAKTKKGPVRWNMILTLGEAGDEQNNPTIYWPTERKKIQAGVLTLTSATPQKGAECEKINFDPLVMSEGVAPTADPILLFRSSAYAASVVKRLTGK
jgi:catalase